MYAPRFVLVLMIVLLAASQSAVAQNRQSAAQLAAEIERYRLNMSDMKKYMQATDNLNALVAGNPSLATAARASLDALDQLESNLMSAPQTIKAVRDAGLTPREYMIISTVVVIVTFADLMSEQEGAAMLKEARIHPDNLKFLRANRAALNAL